MSVASGTVVGTEVRSETLAQAVQRFRLKRTVEVVLNVPFPEDILRLFDLGGYSSEAMGHWIELENRVSTCIPHGLSNLRMTMGDLLMNRMARNLVCQYIEHLVAILNMDKTTYFEALLYLDTYLAKAQPIASLPAAVAAAVFITKKIDGENRWVLRDMRDYICKVVEQLAECLMAIGVSVNTTAPLLIQFIEQEKLMLDCVDYCTGIPTMHTWLRAIVERFDGLCRGTLRIVLDRVFINCLQMAVTYSQYFSTAPSAASPLSQRVKAHGFFCLALVSVHLLPLDLVAPPEIDALEWMQIYFESQPEGTTAAGVLGAHERQQICEVLEFATLCSFAQLQKDTYATALEQRSAMSQMAEQISANIDQTEAPTRVTYVSM